MNELPLSLIISWYEPEGGLRPVGAVAFGHQGDIRAWPVAPGVSNSQCARNTGEKLRHQTHCDAG
jgi:hypothetical protein